MKVLMVGGTGIISTAVSKLAIKKGIDLYVLNRGSQNERLPKKVKKIICDVNDEQAVKQKLEGHYFDSVVQWISFAEEHVKRDYRLFKDFTKQYVFISSASVYQKPTSSLPFVEESAIVGNLHWKYSQNKALCEDYLLSLHDESFNITIIRPSHTYNEQMFVTQLNSYQHPYTMIKRIKEGRKFILPDDGNALWTLTYNEDFAHAFIDVLGNEKTYQEVFHITSDFVYTWERIYEMTCEALDVEPNFIYVPMEKIVEQFPMYKGDLLGDKKDSSIFDNTKIKSISKNYKSKTDYQKILKKVLAYYEKNPSKQTIDIDFETRYEALIELYDTKKT
jgi:nucleoside-diphosphate-sugar epimerase